MMDRMSLLRFPTPPSLDYRDMPPNPKAAVIWNNSSFTDLYVKPVKPEFSPAVPEAAVPEAAVPEAADPEAETAGEDAMLAGIMAAMAAGVVTSFTTPN
jgi:hypothetical protein